MKIINLKYPFDDSIKHHFFIALGLAIWIFLFLYFTEPLDVSEFYDSEKLIYLPIYGLIGGCCYAAFLPFQACLFRCKAQQWTIGSEFIFLFTFSLVSSIVSRLYYYYIIMIDEPNPYTLDYFITDILFPALTIILPILIIGRFAFGKYKEKKVEDAKIEIKGEGTYEGLRVLLNDLICIQSSDNYIEVLYFSGQQVKKSIIRNKLSVIDNEFDELIRTHRSHLINPYHFIQWKTEKGKLFAELSGDIFVPISNTFKNEVKSRIHFTTT